MHTLQKESLLGQADGTFGKASRNRSTDELLALLEEEDRQTNEGDDLAKREKSPFASTGELLALLRMEAKTGFLLMNYLHPSLLAMKSNQHRNEEISLLRQGET